MTPGGRKSEARSLLFIAINFQRINELNVAGELLWGALHHLTEALIDHHTLIKAGQRMKRKEVMIHLQSLSPQNPSLATQFDNIAGLHGNFYNGHISRADLTTAVTAGIQFIQYLIGLPEVRAIR